MATYDSTRRGIQGALFGSRWRKPPQLRRLIAIASASTDTYVRHAHADGCWFYSLTANAETFEWILRQAGICHPSEHGEQPEAVDAVDPSAASTGTPSTRD